MSAHIIVKGAGSPPEKRRAGRKRLYRFDLMEVGDAIFVPLAGRKIGRIDAAHNSLRTAASQYVKRYDPTAKFEIRIVDGSVGCWRVE